MKGTFAAACARTSLANPTLMQLDRLVPFTRDAAWEAFAREGTEPAKTDKCGLDKGVKIILFIDLLSLDREPSMGF
jgi:hypothetical protein